MAEPINPELMAALIAGGAEGGATPDPRMARQIQQRAMAGLDPTPEQMAYLQSVLPAKEARSAKLGGAALELTGVPQMGRAAGAIGEAYNEPSIPNVTNAALHSALAAFRPALAVKSLAGGYGAAIAKDTGLFDSEAQAQQAKQGKKGAPSLSLPGLPQELNAEYTALKKKVTAGDFESSADRQATRARMLQLETLSNEHVTRGGSSKQSEFDRAVKNAESARDAALSRDVRFTDTEAGKVYQKTGGFSPLLAGALTGMVSRAATGGGSNFNNYYLPGALGTAAGIGMNNVPLAFNAFATEPDNPQKRGYEAYARELPPTHERKQEWAEYASRLPEANPVREAASKELYDPVKFAERAAMGGIEGVLGGVAGADGPRIIGRAGSAIAAVPQALLAALGARTRPAGSSPAAASPKTIAGEVVESAPSVEGAVASAQRQLPAPGVPSNLLDALMKSPAPANKNVPKSATDRDIIPGVNKKGIPYHKDADTGHFAEKPKKPDASD